MDIKVKIGSSGGSHMVYWMSNMIMYRLPTEVMRYDCGTDVDSPSIEAI